MTIHSRDDLEGMKQIGHLVGLALREMRAQVRPGMTTAQLDEIGARLLRSQGARSAPQAVYGFPGFNCISVNEEIVHGVPGDRVLQPGDTVKIDVTAERGGFVADAAVTVVLPPAGRRARTVRDCAEAAFHRAMQVASAGRRIAEIGRAVETEAARRRCSVIRELTGHGVGRTIHEEPTVPNFYDPWTPGTLREGQVITVEPLIAARPARAVTADDGWTVCTHNRSLAAHYEHTIVITQAAPLILTAA